MEFSTWLLFCAVASLTIMSPGPAVLLAISNSMTLGLRRVAFSSLGNVSGCLIVASLTMTGLGALLKTSAMLFGVLKLAGAAYLIYLGIKQWRSRSNLFAALAAPAPHDVRSNRALYLQGFFLALTNPNAILFFTALFPQFLSAQHDLLPQFAILIASFMLLSFLSLMAYGLLAHSARRWFASPRRADCFNRGAGAMYMLLGLGLLRLKNSQN